MKSRLTCRTIATITLATFFSSLALASNHKEVCDIMEAPFGFDLQRIMIELVIIPDGHDVIGIPLVKSVLDECPRSLNVINLVIGPSSIDSEYGFTIKKNEKFLEKLSEAQRRAKESKQFVRARVEGVFTVASGYASKRDSKGRIVANGYGRRGLRVYQINVENMSSIELVSLSSLRK